MDNDIKYAKVICDNYFGKLNWCGCGIPDDALDEVQKVLEWASTFGNREIIDTGNPLILCLLYTLDAAGFLEHGSSIYGSWLTETGEEFLKALKYKAKKAWDLHDCSMLGGGD